MASGWRRDPTGEEQRYYELLGDVYEYEPNTSRGLLILRRKVGYAIYGIPDEESKCENAHTGYNERNCKIIKDVVDTIRKLNKAKREEEDQLYMAIVFVFVEDEKQTLQFPVFRVLHTKTAWKFVDMSCRVYSSWQDFLKFNELPKGKFCWPLNGIYRGDSTDKVELRWGVTPAAKVTKKVINAVDKISGAAVLGATGVSLLGLFTPLGTVMAAASLCSTASGLYTVIRSGTALADRGIHGQTVNPLRDRRVALSWLSVAGSAVGMAAGAVASRAATLARNGRVMGRSGRVACNALNVTSLAANAAGVGLGALSLRERIKDRETTPLEVFQFTASLLFFAHATVTFQTASKIITETQKRVIEDFEKSLRSDRHRTHFKKLAKNTAATGEDVVDGNAKVIRGIRSIANKDDFFDGMIGTSKDFGGHRAVFSENGNIIVNGGAEIHPMKLYEMGKLQRKEFLWLAKQVSRGTVSDAVLRARFDSVLSTSETGSFWKNAPLNSDATKAVKTLTAQLQQGIPTITLGRTEVALLMSVVDELTFLVSSKTESKYVKWWHFVWHHVSNLLRGMYETYDEAVNPETQFRSFVDRGRFNLENGIQMSNVFMRFVCKVYSQYTDRIEELIDDIENLKISYICCPQCKQATWQV